jgi:hypothetical protein
MDITVILPAVSDDAVSRGLRELTAAIDQAGLAEKAGGGLGGEDGYGCDYTNDVFEMFPYYWGDCTCGRDAAEMAWEESHHHAPTCYQIELEALDDPFGEDRNQVRELCAKHQVSWPDGAMVHCTCGLDETYTVWLDHHPHERGCLEDRANFTHKPSGTTVRWYKYIGRDMDVDLHGNWEDILAECLASLEPTAT